jgi:hypothetical protein
MGGALLLDGRSTCSFSRMQDWLHERLHSRPLKVYCGRTALCARRTLWEHTERVRSLVNSHDALGTQWSLEEGREGAGGLVPVDAPPGPAYAASSE